MLCTVCITCSYQIFFFKVALHFSRKKKRYFLLQTDANLSSVDVSWVVHF